ncbi:hypothetical protein [Staphylococcus haemolyticus]|uniref:hypothetical protein n=1 Tax=Staphylococcus haemolyticus TaxID=1283 RepID=UPI001F0B07B6|nr:hypothetical protein [Staphylococcus haemolyticus]MCH4519577.1 hypothetical protein [Staphylococcus haemolyticus]
MRGTQAILKDGSRVKIIEVVNRELASQYWKLRVIDSNNEVSVINISEIRLLGGT